MTMVRSSKGIGCERTKRARSGRVRRTHARRTNAFVETKLLGLVDDLVPSEDEDVVEQVDLEIGRLGGRPSSSLKLTLVDELPLLVLQAEFLRSNQSITQRQQMSSRRERRARAGRLTFASLGLSCESRCARSILFCVFPAAVLTLSRKSSNSLSTSGMSLWSGLSSDVTLRIALSSKGYLPSLVVGRVRNPLSSIFLDSGLRSTSSTNLTNSGLSSFSFSNSCLPYCW